MLQRLHVSVLFGLLGVVSACAVRTESCPRVAENEKPAAVSPTEPAAALPRQLTIEMQKDGTLHIDGEVTRIPTLAEDYQRLTQQTEFTDTVFWVEEGVSPKQAAAVFETLLDAHAPHLRYALRPTDVVQHIESKKPVPDPGPNENSSQAALKEAAAEEIALSASVLNEHEKAAINQVDLKSVGLHLGGAPKDEMTRRSVLGLIERRFDEFRNCYPLTTELKKPATFGVDLYVGVDGGKVTIKDVRTRIGPEGFRQCMLDAFSKLDFPPLATRPVMISYSLEAVSKTQKESGQAETPKP
jgi:hypothetical protein